MDKFVISRCLLSRRRIKSIPRGGRLLLHLVISNPTSPSSDVVSNESMTPSLAPSTSPPLTRRRRPLRQSSHKIRLGAPSHGRPLMLLANPNPLLSSLSPSDTTSQRRCPSFPPHCLQHRLLLSGHSLLLCHILIQICSAAFFLFPGAGGLAIYIDGVRTMSCFLIGHVFYSPALLTCSYLPPCNNTCLLGSCITNQRFRCMVHHYWLFWLIKSSGSM